MRDSIAGIGTVTYIDPETGAYGALGHGVNDLGTTRLLPVETGMLVPASVESVRRGVRVCLAMAAGITLFISVTFYNLAEPLFRLFSQDDAVVAVGVGMMHVLTPVYITYISIEVLSGALRGCGDVRVPTLITVFFVCGLRMLWLFIAVPIRHEVATVEMSYPITWSLASALFILYYVKGGWMQRCAEKWEKKQAG